MDKINDIITAAGLPEEIESAAIASLRTPQRGPYHNEGAFMEAHLELMFETLNDVRGGVFHPDINSGLADEMFNAWHAHISDVVRHVFLHDIEKQSCLSLIFADGHKEERHSLTGLPLESAETWERYCEEQGIVQIGYYHGEGSNMRMHGRVAAERLKQYSDQQTWYLDLDLLLFGIETHDVATAFSDRGGVNIPLFEEYFSKLERHEIGYIMLVNYLDQMASLGSDGKPKLDDFLWLAKTWRAWQDFNEVKRHFGEQKRINRHKFEQFLAKLRNAKNAFQDEDLDQTIERLKREVILPEVTADQVREALTHAVAEGLPTDLVDAIVAEMTSDGKVSSETGKRLGRFNKLVRPALAKLEQ